MDAHTRNQAASDEVSLDEVLEALARRKWLVLSFAFVLSASAAGIAWWLPKTYTATVLMSPVSSTPGAGQFGGLSSLASQFGGLASLAGISLSGDSKKWESVAVLESEALTEQFVQQNDLLPVLYARDWDAQTHRWRQSDPKKVPTLWKAYRRFDKEIRKVVVDNKTGLVTLSIAWKDPVAAARWANELVKMTNENLRNRAIQESERNIAYLNDQAAKTTVVEARHAIYLVLQTELNKSMLARGSDEYAFRVLDPARVPEKPSSLGAKMWALIGLVVSLVLSLLGAFIRVASGKRKASDT